MKNVHEFWHLSPINVQSFLNTSRTGLSSFEAARRLALEKKRSGDTSFWKRNVRLFLKQYTNPLILLLLFAVILSLFTGEYVNSTIIIAVLMLTGIAGFMQERKANSAVEHLRSMISSVATVLRDGNEVTVEISQVVHGDIAVLNAGDIIPADGLLLASRDLHVDESALTGESFPAEKHFLDVYTDDTSRNNAVFAGTSVVSGTATMLAINTGKDSELGAIGERLATDEIESSQEQGIRKFGYFLLRITLLVSIIVFVLNLVLNKPLVDSLLFSLALAVGLAPEMLPAILTVTMSAGARRMSEKKVIVKHLNAISNLGAMDILCADKTGTLTEGSVAIYKCISTDEVEDEKVKELAFLNAIFESGFANPIDEAIRRLPGCETRGHTKVDEVPYDFIRKRLSIVVDDGTKQTMITKGAFSNIIDSCKYTGTPGGIINDLNSSRGRLQLLYEKLGKEGYRIIAVCWKDVTGDAIINKDDEIEMTLAGFLIFEDPCKAGIVDSLQRLVQRGISFKMITGDNRNVALHVADQIGLLKKGVLTGEQIAKTGSRGLGRLVAEYDVFAEVEPLQKEAVIRALRDNGHVVGFLGDGINDAQALRMSDVGISVDTAVDVAKESADLVLMERSIDALTEGVLEGRKTFINTRKYVRLTTSANFGNMASMAFFSLALPFLPLLPMQILLNNFLSDIPSLAIASDRVDDSELKKPCRWDLPAVRRFMIIFGLHSSVFDFVTFFLLIYFLKSDEHTFRTAWFVESLITELLIIFVIRSPFSVYKSRPSRLLIMLTLAVLSVTVLLPILPLAGNWLGFAELGTNYFMVICCIAISYFFTAEVLKRGLGRTGAIPEFADLDPEDAHKAGNKTDQQ